ncbi:MAG TPA: T9SS type A sorting domain-containing protein, partial [Brumimicrobium sp.]|nr:T9SS type A sorting domain-containing protein [Brumimicrobium sp.]
DFHANYLTTCVGESIQFKNHSWRLAGNNAIYTWTFEDGSTVTTNDENPSVSFTKPGWKKVQLTVEENGLTHTIVKDKFIHVSPNWSPFSGNLRFHFNDNPDYWIIENPQRNSYQWQVRNDAGRNGSGGIYLNNSSTVDDPILFSSEYFFDNRRGGVKSSFISQAIDLSNMTNISCSFDWACATDGTNVDEIVEKLVIYVSTNCGKTWIPRKTITGTDLVNNGAGWESFYPNSGTLWSTESFNLTGSNLNHVFLKFEYVGSDKSNNIAIDNINIDGILNTEALSQENKLKVYPNPSSSSFGWNVNYDPTEWGGAQMQLTDMAGRTVASGQLPSNQSEWNIKAGDGASQGIYILKISHNDKIIQKKLILQ